MHVENCVENFNMCWKCVEIAKLQPFLPIYVHNSINQSKNSPVKGWRDLSKMSEPIFNPFEIRAKMKTKVQNLTKMSIFHRKICNAPLDALMCPLQIINWHWTLIIDPSWHKYMLYPPPVQTQKLLNQP